MSMDYVVVKGKIPFTILKKMVMSKQIPGATYSIGKDFKSNRAFGIKYSRSPLGLWQAYPTSNGGTMFTEYAGGHGNDAAMIRLLERLEKIFKCEIWDEMMVTTLKRELPKAKAHAISILKKK